MVKKITPNWLWVILVLTLTAVACICSAPFNQFRADPTGMQIEPRATDGSISGRYHYSGSAGREIVHFSVNADGLATFKTENAPETETLVVKSTHDDAPAHLIWQGIELNGLGALTSAEHEVLDNLFTSDLAHGLAMIPLDIACEGEDVIDHKQVASLLFPLQIQFKYLISERAYFAGQLAELSQCHYQLGVEKETGKNPPVILMSSASPIPVVFGFFPFDEVGALEVVSNSIGVQMSQFDKTTLLSFPLNPPALTFPGINRFGPEPIQNEWGPCDAKCRGACGPDCIQTNCNREIVNRCEKDQHGEKTGEFSMIYIYDCGIHPACIKHDQCYDDCNSRWGCESWAAAVCMHAGVFDPTAPTMMWVSAYNSCDLLTVKEEESSHVLSWVAGFGPFTQRQIYEYHDEDIRYFEDTARCPLPDRAVEIKPDVMTDKEDEPEQVTTPSLVWIRQGEPIINRNNQPLRRDYGDDPRRQDAFTQWSVSEGQIDSRHRYHEDDVVWYDVSFTCVFSKPPLILIPSETYELTATFSHSAIITEYSYQGIGEQFEFSVSPGSGGALYRPDVVDVLAYYPWSDWFDGTTTDTWVLDVPYSINLGDSFEVYASFWNCPPCDVAWTYVAGYAE